MRARVKRGDPLSLASSSHAGPDSVPVPRETPAVPAGDSLAERSARRLDWPHGATGLHGWSHGRPGASGQGLPGLASLVWRVLEAPSPPHRTGRLTLGKLEGGYLCNFNAGCGSDICIEHTCPNSATSDCYSITTDLQTKRWKNLCGEGQRRQLANVGPRGPNGLLWPQEEARCGGCSARGTSRSER